MSVPLFRHFFWYLLPLVCAPCYWLCSGLFQYWHLLLAFIVYIPFHAFHSHRLYDFLFFPCLSTFPPSHPPSTLPSSRLLTPSTKQTTRNPTVQARPCSHRHPRSLPVSYNRTDGHIFPLLQAAPTASRTAADLIHCVPHFQSQPDLQSGGLHAEDKGYTTAYSYFLEAFQNLGTQDDGKGALGVLKYMLWCNVMLNLVSRLCRCCCLRSGTFIGYFFYWR